MPLRDHFRPPVDDHHSWDEVHGQWPAMIVQQLFPLLPEGYEAAPRVHLGTFCEIDIAAFETNDAGSSQPTADGGAATALEAPPFPPSLLKPTFPLRMSTKSESTTLSAAAGWWRRSKSSVRRTKTGRNTARPSWRSVWHYCSRKCAFR